MNCNGRFRWIPAAVFAIGLAAGVAIFGCAPKDTGPPERGEEPPPISTAPPASAPDSPAADSGESRDTVEKRYDGIRYRIPSSWRELPPSPAVDSKFEIDTPQGTLQLTLTTMGGGIEANFQRWTQQMGGATPRRETIEVDGRTAEWIDLRGTYQSGFGPAGRKHEDYRLIGVAIPLEPRAFFIKLVGPREAVDAFLPEFEQFVRSGKIEP